LAISEYLGIGPVMQLTHPDRGKYCRGTRDSLKDDAKKKYETLASILDEHQAELELEADREILKQVRDHLAALDDFIRIKVIESPDCDLGTKRDELIARFNHPILARKHELKDWFNAVFGVTPREIVSSSSTPFEVYYPFHEHFKDCFVQLMKTIKEQKVKDNVNCYQFAVAIDEDLNARDWAESVPRLQLSCFAVRFEAAESLNVSGLISTTPDGYTLFARRRFDLFGGFYLFKKAASGWHGLDLSLYGRGKPIAEDIRSVSFASIFAPRQPSDDEVVAIQADLCPEAAPEHTQMFLFCFEGWRQT